MSLSYSNKESRVSQTVSTSHPLVSIAIVSYNQERFIAEAIQGAIAQDYRPIEIVIADDCSTDNTPNIIREFSTKYPDLIVALLGSENLGVTGNSNRALSACKGKYINMLGGDDILLPKKISSQVDWMEQDANRVFCGHACEIFYDEEAIPPKVAYPFFTFGKGPKQIFMNGPPYLALSVLFRKSALPPYGFDKNILIASDFMLWIDLAGGGGLWGCVNGVHARYRKHSGGLSHISRQENLLIDTEQVIKIASARYKLYGYQNISIMNLCTIPKLVFFFKKRMLFRFASEFTSSLLKNPIVFTSCCLRILARRRKSRRNKF